MSSKRGNLSAALKEVSGRPEPARLPPAPDVEQPQPALQSRAGRVGKIQISGFFEKPVHKQLKKLAVDSDAGTVQELLREAINDLFAKHSLPPIA
jgi:hypothetical protein